MKKIISILSVFAIALLVHNTPAHAIGIGVGANSNASITSNDASASGTVSGSVSATGTEDNLTWPQARNRAENERDQLVNVNQQIQANVATFKNNLVAIKNAPLSQKKDFLVTTYNNAYNFFTQEHDQFVNALNVAESHGVDVSVARNHFQDAWNIMVQANTDAKTLASMDLSNTTLAQAKTLAKKIEEAYRTVRNDMHLGAVALKVAIQARMQTTTSTPTTGTGSTSVESH